MEKVFLSFLGTGKYIPCNYTYADIKIQNVCYIQEALISMFCQNWGADDRILIFTTNDAYKMHWESENGLKEKLLTKNIKSKIEQVNIPDGKTEDEIWMIFDIVFNILKNEDKVIYDVTHSFRSLPMLGIVLLNYAKFLKNISIDGIYYGAFESLGRAQDIEKNIPLEKRDAPVFDLTSFDNLLNWSVAADNFVNYGNSEKLVTCIKDGSKILRSKKETITDANLLNKLAINIGKISDEITTVRGKIIYSAESFVKTKMSINQIRNNDISFKAMNPILEKVENKIDKFLENDFMNGLHAVEWCIKHDMIQQGLTLLEETIITTIAIVEKDKISDATSIIKDNSIFQDQKIREDISSAIHIIHRNIPKDDWKVTDKQIVKVLIKSDLLKSLARDFSGLSDYRNDINHGGYNEKSTSSQSLKDKLKSSYESVFKIITNYLK